MDRNMDNLIDLNSSFGDSRKSSNLATDNQVCKFPFGLSLMSVEMINRNPFDEVEQKALNFDDPFENPGFKTIQQQTVVSQNISSDTLVSVGEFNIDKRHQVQQRSSISEEHKHLKLTSFKEERRISYEDINAIKPQWLDSSTAELSFTSELEQMKLIDVKIEPVDPDYLEDIAIKEEDCVEEQIQVPLIIKEEIPDEVFEVEPEKSNDNVENLLCDLKQAISESKQQKASELLDNLSKVLSNNKNDSTKISQTNSVSDDSGNLQVPSPIIRQDTFDIDKSENHSNDEMETSQENMGPCDQSNFAQQIADIITCSTSINQLGRLQASKSDTTAVYQPLIVVVPSLLTNQNQGFRTRRSMSLSLDKRTNSEEKMPAPSNKKEVSTSTSKTPSKISTRLSTMTRRSSFTTTPQQTSKVSSRQSLLPPGSSRKTQNSLKIPVSPARKFGDNSNITRTENTRRLSCVPKSFELRPKMGAGIKKPAGPLKAIPIPHLSYGSKKEGDENKVQRTSKLPGSVTPRVSMASTSRLMPKSPSLLKRNSRLSSTPQPQTKLSIACTPARTRSSSVGKKKLLNEF